MITLQPGQLLGNAWPGSSHDAGDVLVAERDLQQCPARIFDAEIVTEIEHCNCDAFMKIETKQT